MSPTPRRRARERDTVGSDASWTRRVVTHRGFLERRPPNPVALAHRIGQRAAIGHLELAIERIGRLDGLELHQRGPSVGLGRPRHGAAVEPAHQLALIAHEGDLLWRRLAIEQRDRDVAAQDLAGIGAQPFLDGAAERQDRGDGADAQRQAGDEQAETAEAAAHLAAGEAEGEAHGNAVTARRACAGDRPRPTGRRRSAAPGRTARRGPCRA